MRITKFEHAAVRIEHDGKALVIDPGNWTRPESVDGATAVLITHEHFDHYHLDNLRATDAPIYTIDAVAKQIQAADPEVFERVTVVKPGDTFDAGLPIEAVGEIHATIHPTLPTFYNSGFVITLGDKRVYHPGDAFNPPPAPVDVFCLPISAPWMKLWECMDFAKEVSAPVTIAVHENIYSEAGQALADGRVAALLGEGFEYKHLKPGEDL